MKVSTVTPIGQGAPAPLAFVREGIARLTPAQANAVLRECAFDGQRRIDPIHVATLAELMRRDLWSPKDKLDFARVGERLVLVNGYHRMTAQVTSAKDIEWMIAIHDCASPEDLKGLYHRFDTNLRARTVNNILQGAGFAEAQGLSALAANALYRATGIIAAGFQMGQRLAMTPEDKVARRIVDDRLALCDTYAPAMRSFEEAMAPAPALVRSQVRTAGFVAVAVMTFHHAPAQAQDFWTGLARNDGLRRTDPRAVLLTDLLSRNRHVGPVVASMVQPAKAWNAYVDGRPMSMLRVRAGESVALRHTPYTIVT